MRNREDDELEDPVTNSGPYTEEQMKRIETVGPVPLCTLLMALESPRFEGLTLEELCDDIHRLGPDGLLRIAEDWVYLTGLPPAG
jgi:hypothetical protein